MCDCLLTYAYLALKNYKNMDISPRNSSKTINQSFSPVSYSHNIFYIIYIIFYMQWLRKMSPQHKFTPFNVLTILYHAFPPSPIICPLGWEHRPLLLCIPSVGAPGTIYQIEQSCKVGHLLFWVSFFIWMTLKWKQLIWRYLIFTILNVLPIEKYFIGYRFLR